MKGISLIGLPMSGKSTLAKLLEGRLRIERLDVDDWVSEDIGLNLPLAAELYGTDYLLQKEWECIRRNNLQNKIVATPGSIIYTKAKDKLQEETLVVYLEQDLQTILEKLQGDSSEHRVVLGEGPLGDVLAARLPVYEEWSNEIVSCCNDRSIKDTAEEVVDIYKKLKQRM